MAQREETLDLSQLWLRLREIADNRRVQIQRRKRSWVGKESKSFVLQRERRTERGIGWWRGEDITDNIGEEGQSCKSRIIEGHVSEVMEGKRLYSTLEQLTFLCEALSHHPILCGWLIFDGSYFTLQLHFHKLFILIYYFYDYTDCNCIVRL